MTAPVLSVVGLGKDYGDRRAVDAVDLEVTPGEIVGLLGPHGAGKTTTISMASGVVTPSRGEAFVDGHDVWRAPRKAKRALGLVPQELALYEELSAIENLRYFGRIYGLGGAELGQRVEWALGVAGLADRAKDRVDKYSGGMKRRLNLVAGLLHKPKLLVLDEPTVGVDPQSRRHIFDTVEKLRDEGLAVLYTSHYMEEVEALCDRIAIMDRGVLVAKGSIDELVGAHGDGYDVDVDGEVVHLPAATKIVPALAELEASGKTIRSISSRRANLEGVFLALTGRALRDE